jgi:hypothetical protein
MARTIFAALAGLLIGGCVATGPQDQDTHVNATSTGDGSQKQLQLQLQSQKALPTVSVSATQMSAEQIVQRLAELGGDGLPPGPKSPSFPREQLRLELYKRLLEFGDGALPALAQGLHDPNFMVRRNVVLFLLMGRGYRQEIREVRHPNMNMHVLLPDLVKALKDTDGTVRAWAAQSVGGFGRDAKEAVPDLITLLRNDDEGSRNSACIALRQIGAAAKAALPALREALFDPSADVRAFAARAIEAIERP